MRKTNLRRWKLENRKLHVDDAFPSLKSQGWSSYFRLKSCHKCLVEKTLNCFIYFSCVYRAIASKNKLFHWIRYLLKRYKCSNSFDNKSTTLIQTFTKTTVTTLILIGHLPIRYRDCSDEQRSHMPSEKWQM